MENAKKREEKVLVEVPKNLQVTREPFISAKDNKQMFAYVVKGETMVNGEPKELKADFVAKDKGGYEVLSLIFMFGDTADIVVRDEIMVDDNGNKTAYSVYEVQTVVDDILYSYPVKPLQVSDKSIFNVLQQLHKKKYNAYIEAKARLEADAGNS